MVRTPRASPVAVGATVAKTAGRASAAAGRRAVAAGRTEAKAEAGGEEKTRGASDRSGLVVTGAPFVANIVPRCS